jgi:hypothetical protein
LQQALPAAIDRYEEKAREAAFCISYCFTFERFVTAAKDF